MTTTTQTVPADRLARVLAPDDLATGIFINVLRVRNEYFPCGIFSEVNEHTRPVQVQMMPWNDEQLGTMRVIDFCLPFVLVRKPTGEAVTLDARQYQFAQLSDTFGQAVFAEARRARKASRNAKSD